MYDYFFPLYANRAQDLYDAGSLQQKVEEEATGRKKKERKRE